ncbi:DNA-directed RNA polymerase subunit beta'' [Striga asiatica]|uniref:DNA-directed RNA polymerase subunit beta n=1 Tax=Striga asiatica TaxID=4170 RepID=A0A5A7Q5W3_STRAF|nr:DNA-directed RNA polymerase subunit beta'' [Striga asiatica]
MSPEDQNFYAACSHQDMADMEFLDDEPGLESAQASCPVRAPSNGKIKFNEDLVHPTRNRLLDLFPYARELSITDVAIRMITTVVAVGQCLCKTRRRLAYYCVRSPHARCAKNHKTLRQ